MKKQILLFIRIPARNHTTINKTHESSKGGAWVFFCAQSVHCCVKVKAGQEEPSDDI